VNGTGDELRLPPQRVHADRAVRRESFELARRVDERLVANRPSRTDESMREPAELVSAPLLGGPLDSLDQKRRLARERRPERRDDLVVPTHRRPRSCAAATASARRRTPSFE
jgi:hypothetical protein